MRIPIREQLALLLLLSSLIGLGVISIATWVANHSFVLSVSSSKLSVTASLKAAQLTSNLNLMQTTANFVSTRILLQNALESYNRFGTTSSSAWSSADHDLLAAISGEGSLGQILLLQGALFPKNASGPAGTRALLNVTSPTVAQSIKLPYFCPNGTQVWFGMDSTACNGLGYPPQLYPNLTFLSSSSGVQEAVYDGDILGPEDTLLIGPWPINETFALLSLTLAITNTNTSSSDVLGWLTVVMDARLIRAVLNSTEGLGRTGQTLLVGPANRTNLFSNRANSTEDFLVRYVLPLNETFDDRHTNYTLASSSAPFNANQYPAVLSALTKVTEQPDNSGAMIRTHNEAGKKVAVGFAVPQTPLVDWVVIVEQAKREVWAPINTLRDILLACLFGTLGLLAVVAFPLAHVASLPIRRLREATTKSIAPPGTSRSSLNTLHSETRPEDNLDSPEDETTESLGFAWKESLVKHNPLNVWREKRTRDREDRGEDHRRRQFRIPGKVKQRKPYVKDELSDLTATFNEMSDELMTQYERLEERVRQRTAELELSKKAAEAANESKTLFIANISHELKTPLNGILGMTAICMHEDDPVRLKHSLGIIYKSGDLLLNLLTDLLTFSKNQVGQQLSLDEKEFQLRDISTQVLAIFDKQAKEGAIGLQVEWEGVHNLLADDESSMPAHDLGPVGTGRLKDMILWGDMSRILQVVINLVSNSLKFTPAGGSVVLTIRCLSEAPDLVSRKASQTSRPSRQPSRTKGSDVTLPASKLDTANSINPKDKPNAIVNVQTSERTASPPPGKQLYFEFEVSDTGPGIREDLQDKIFEPFMQGDLGLSKKFGGTGLGLSICSQLASLMRGSIGMRSDVGVGSTFTMKLPLRLLKSHAESSANSNVEMSDAIDEDKNVSTREEDRLPALHDGHVIANDKGAETKTTAANLSTGSNPAVNLDLQPRLVGLSQPFFATSKPVDSQTSKPKAIKTNSDNVAQSNGKIRVLVAEDNKVNQEVVLRMLKLENVFDVVMAKDGQEALDFVKDSLTPSPTNQNKPFNLIFMDVQMPNVDGIQSTRLIREIGYQAPIVALTAFAEESNIKDCLDSGMNYFLSKPIRRPQLKKVLKQYCPPIPEENEELCPFHKEPLVCKPNHTDDVLNGSSFEKQANNQPNEALKEDHNISGPHPTRVTKSLDQCDSGDV